MMKNTLGLPKIYYLLILLIGGVIFLLTCVGVVDKNDFAMALMAMLGTFVGGLFAFRLEENKETKKREEENKQALNATLFIIYRQYNAIVNLKAKFFEKQPGMDMAFNAPAYQPPKYDDLTYNFSGLSFLLQEDPNMLLQLSVGQEAFVRTLESIRIRNEFFVGQVIPAIDKNKLHKASILSAELEEKVGKMIFDGAMAGAKAVYENILGSEKSLRELGDAVYKLAKKLFPRDAFLKLED